MIAKNVSESKNLQMVLHTDRCKGCGYCVLECRAGALFLSSELNLAGYNPVIINDEKCTLCGLCFLVCPDYVYEFVKEAP